MKMKRNEKKKSSQSKRTRTWSTTTVVEAELIDFTNNNNNNRKKAAIRAKYAGLLSEISKGDDSDDNDDNEEDGDEKGDDEESKEEILAGIGSPLPLLQLNNELTISCLGGMKVKKGGKKDDFEMEITFTPGLSDLASDLIKKKQVFCDTISTSRRRSFLVDHMSSFPSSSSSFPTKNRRKIRTQMRHLGIHI